MSKPSHHEATVYLHIEPIWSQRYPLGPGDETHFLAGVKVTKMTANRPRSISGLVAKLRLRLPAAAFAPLRPEIVVEIPESALDAGPPEVTVFLPDLADD